MRAPVELGDDAATCRGEPRRGALAQDRDRHLGHHRHPERVGEAAVEGGGRHHRHASGTVREVVQVEAEQAFTERRRQRLPNVRCNAGRGALDGHAPNPECRRPTRGGVETERGHEDQQPDQERPAGRSDLGQLETTARAAAWKAHGEWSTRSRAWATP